MDRIKFKKEYIGWGIGILGIIISIILGMQNKQLINNQQEWQNDKNIIYNKAKEIEQHFITYNYNLPPYIMDSINVIETVTGPVAKVKDFRHRE